MPAAFPDRSRRRRLVVGSLSFAALILPCAAPPTTAATGGLTVVAQTRYDVEPAAHRVHVTVAAVATNHEPDSSAGQTYYTGLNFAVQPGAANVRATADGLAIGASITRREDDFSVISVSFARGVFYRQSYAYTVTFDLVDAGGKGTRDLRIGTSLTAFPVWAFGTEGERANSVSVDLPDGYTPDVQGEPMTQSQRPDGGTRLSASPQDPVRFFAYVTADRPGAFANTTTRVDVNGIPTSVLVRSWDDDPGWGHRVTNLMRRGLPVLQSLIGFDYPGHEPRSLTVEEAATSRLGEYAGIYDPDVSLIQIRYDADAVVTLHEAAHIWFNSTLFKDRWIGEAWAEYYAARAVARLGAHGLTPQLTDEMLRSQIPLNDWGAIGVESLDVEDFAYAATYKVAREIAKRAGTDDLRLVWQAADTDQEAYLPIHHAPAAPTHVALDVQDWQRLLDLLEERSGAAFSDLWRGWIVNDKQLPLLAQRESARHRYEEVVDAAGAWELPASIRHGMGLWQFDAAKAQLDAALAVLRERDEITAQADRLDLTAPAALRAAFEGDGGLSAAASEATAELRTMGELEAAGKHLDAGDGLLQMIGLLGNDPAAQLASARDQFEHGDLAAADRQAAGLVSSVQGAVDAGRVRVVAVGGALLLLDGAWLWTRRPGRRRPGSRAAA